MSLFDFLAGTRTPKKRLEDAVKSNDLGELDKLIQEGVDTNMRLQNHGGNTAIHFAAYMGHYRCIERLLTAGASANMSNDSEITPLINAARKEHPLAMQVLLKAMPEIQLDSLWSHRLWSDMLYSHSKDDVLVTLIAATPNLNEARPNLKISLLLICRKETHLNSVKMLLMTGIDRNIEQMKSLLCELMTIFETLTDTDTGPEDERQIQFRDWYSDFNKNAQSLQHYCRLVIRRRLHGKCNVFYGVTQLPIPKAVKKYICFV